MRFKTKNGLICISPNVFTKISAYAAENCFGVRELYNPSLEESIKCIGERIRARKGVRLTFDHGTVRIDLRIALVNGVNMQEVCRSIRNEVRYMVEKYTGVKVSGVRIFVEAVTER